MTPDEKRLLAAVKSEIKAKNIGYSVRGGPIRDRHGEPEGVVSNPDALVRLHASTDIIVREIAAQLTTKLPGFQWAIQPSEFGKVFNIFCLDFSGLWGYRIRYDDIINDPRRREVVRAGREILRRFRYHGTRYDPVQVGAVPRNLRGEALPDLSDLKSTRMSRQVKLQHDIAIGNAKLVGSIDNRPVVQTKG